MNIAIIGNGNGGHAFSLFLKSKNANVNWLFKNIEMLNVIKNNDNVICEVNNKYPPARIDYCGLNVEKVLNNVGIVFVIVESNIHEDIAKLIAPYVNDGQTIILLPGRTCGALFFSNCLKKYGCTANVCIGETASLPLTCRMVNYGIVEILKEKKFEQIAFLSNKYNKSHLEFLLKSFQGLVYVDSCMVTSLSNIGAILHPAPMLLNIGRIESDKNGFLHYYDGITPTIALFIEKLDNERLMIGRSFGVELLSVIDWHYEVYGIKGNTLYETIQKNTQYASLFAPKTLNHRYIYEDISTGLVPLAVLADNMNVDATCINIIIDLAEKIFNYPFRENGRNRNVLNL